jgi:mRNA interferase RelE/StbE
VPRPLYRVEFTPRAQRELETLPKGVQQRIVDKATLLAVDPHPAASKKLQGEEGLYRIRAGDYRIVYSIHDALLLVLIVRIGHRREVYRKRR